MPCKLDIFDFDGTLVNTPLDTTENRRLYENDKGIPWIIDKETSRRLSAKHRKHIGMRRGWYGRRETLEPPLVPNPTPKSIFIPKVCDQFRESKANEEAITLLMTGRHAGIMAQVLRICGDGKLVDVKHKGIKDGKLYVDCVDANVQCLFMGQNGPDPQGTKPNETLPWKMWIIEQYVRVFPDLEKIEIWEDREAHVAEFRELNDLFDQDVIVNHIQS